jgi:hypothetical protein
MMLNGAPGSICTACGFAPSGASQSPIDIGISRNDAGSFCPSSAASIVASRNRIFAPQSASIVTNASGVDDGASGATATPARSAPRKIAPYSTHEAPQMEMTSPD